MSKPVTDVPTESRMRKEILGLVWLALGIFLLLCLGSYSNSDPSFNNNLNPSRITNLGGVFGAHLADLLFQAFGLTALLCPLACLQLAWRWLKFREVHFRIIRLIAFVLLLITMGGLLALKFDKVQLFHSQINEAGGAVGRILVQVLASYLNTGGAAIVLVVFFLVSLILSTRFSLVLFIDGFLERIGRRLELGREARQARSELRRKAKREPEIRAPLILQPEPKKLPEPAINKKKKKKTDEENQEAFSFLEPTGTYHTPGLSLLNHEGGEPKPIDRDSLTMAARMLEKKLLDFGVEGDVVEVKPGPVVTMYEFAPAPGVKVNKIANLQDDLAMALQAVSIRIVAPIPGRGVVGIEIPNKERAMVYLKEIIADEAFQKTGGRLPMALGKDIFGQVVVSDLSKMPHLLVAGSTGSGKSVSINTMILSLLYRASPEDVRLIMIDPKMLELSIYEGIPHLLLPVVTNPKKAALALGWAVREMERRYQLMADKGVRNIDGYNRKLVKEAKEAADARPFHDDPGIDIAEEFDIPEMIVPEPEQQLEHGHLPYIVVIVDELADLMMVAGRDIEESIARLAQMARAAGIHLILATQRPSVDVITGLIKANFPTRISFKVFSKTDSRTILDNNGAEALLGMGDMLYLPPGVGYLERVHGAFVSELEVQRVVDFLSKQGNPAYDKSILQPPPATASGEEEDQEQDELWDSALRIVSETRLASISMLQRRLRVGYNRAARMIEKMEQEGIVGQSDGSGKPREVLISKIE